MVEVTDPPNAERKKAKPVKRVRGPRRLLVNRQTLMIAIRLIGLIVRLAEVISKLHGGF